MTTLHDFDKTQTNILAAGGIVIAITPDDIITLKLLRDDFHRTRFTHNEDPLRGLDYLPERPQIIKTLERILLQIH